MMAKGKGRRARGVLLLGRFYFSKWLTFPVLGLTKVLVFINASEVGKFPFFLTPSLTVYFKIILLIKLYNLAI